MKFYHWPRQLAVFLYEGPSRWQRSNQKNVNKRKATLNFAPSSAFRNPVTSAVLPSIFCCPRDFFPGPILVLYIHSCGRKPWVPSTCAGDLMELLRVPLRSQGYCGVGRSLSGLHWVWCNGWEPHLEWRQEPHVSSPGFPVAGTDSDRSFPAELVQKIRSRLVWRNGSHFPDWGLNPGHSSESVKS